MNSNSVTIATHNGHSLCREHNIRLERIVRNQPHIDQNGRYEVWHDETIKAAYKRLFSQAVEDYNRKQDRPERRINDYYRHVQNDKKKHTAYELICGVYSPDVPEKTIHDILRDYYISFKRRNPFLEVIGCYYHADESSPHIHLDYIPVGRGFKYGPEVQCSLTVALKSQGYEKRGKHTAQILWEKDENKSLENICNRYGLVVQHKNENRNHLETTEYKTVKQGENDNSIEDVINGLHETKTMNRNRVTVDKNALESLKSELLEYKSLPSAHVLKCKSRTLKEREDKIERQKLLLKNDIDILEEQRHTLACKKRRLKESHASFSSWLRELVAVVYACIRLLSQIVLDGGHFSEQAQLLSDELRKVISPFVDEVKKENTRTQ